MGGVDPSAFCIDGCGRRQQHRKGGRCCTCYRRVNGIPAWIPGKSPRQQRLDALPVPRFSPPDGADVVEVSPVLVVAAAEALAPVVAPAAVPRAQCGARPPWVPAGQVPPRCRQCGVRWAQMVGYCRTCLREVAGAAGYASVVQFLEARHIAREEAKHAGAVRPLLEARPVREVEADGVAYVVESSSVRTLAEGELERELAAARNPVGWAGDGSPWSRVRQRKV